jgi:D-glucosaminate-6-phosphate ammonia-lyase
MAVQLELGVYEKLGVKRIVNGWGTITRVGGSLMPPEVVAAMAEAARAFVDLDELYVKAGEVVAKHTGAEAGLVTTGCAASLMLGTAAAVAGMDPAKHRRLPNTDGMKNEVIIHTSHRNGYDHSFRAAGVDLVEIGYANRTEPWELENAIGPNTAAVAYVIAPWLTGGFLPLDVTCQIAHRHGVPVIVDSSAMLPPAENLTKWIGMGADLVAFSGGKGIMGPQASGILAGKRELVESARLQMSPNHALGRTCKVGKEEVIGLVTALELYAKRDHMADMERWRRQAETIVQTVGDLPGVRASVDGSPRSGAPSALIALDPDRGGPSAAEIAARLKAGDPPIYVGATADGVRVNTHVLEPGEAELIGSRLRMVLTSR